MHHCPLIYLWQLYRSLSFFYSGFSPGVLENAKCQQNILILNWGGQYSQEKLASELCDGFNLFKYNGLDLL